MIKKSMQKRVYLIASVALCAFVMCFVDAVIKPEYFIKSIIKLILFLVVPSVFFIINSDERASLKKLFIPDGKGLLRSLFLGFCVYGIILGGYFLLKNSFDFSGIAGKLTANSGVSAENFLYVSLYISFINSLLEEIFFRGFGFIMLKNASSRAFAYIFSASFFALYHVGMMIGYYGAHVLALVVVGLLAAGIMFNFINEKSENIYTSWLVHMFANFAINTVGAILFGII
jgi:membrane protease YdiL (CAAX protease family)